MQVKRIIIYTFSYTNTYETTIYLESSNIGILSHLQESMSIKCVPLLCDLHAENPSGVNPVMHTYVIIGKSLSN